MFTAILNVPNNYLTMMTIYGSLYISNSLTLRLPHHTVKEWHMLVATKNSHYLISIEEWRAQRMN